MLMKKSLIALAVAGALAAPMVAQADATLYGSLRVMVVDQEDSELNVADNSSRIGIKGSVDTGIDGVKAIYRGEWKVNTADGADFGAGRLAYVGLTGGFGTAAIGQQWTPYYTFVTGATDILDGKSTAPTQDVFRTGNAIAYVSPEMGGFQGALVAIADDNANGEDVDAYNVAAKYSVAGFTVGASLLTDEASDNDMTAVSAAYAAGPLYVAALYQDKEAADVKQWELAGSYAFGDTKVLANYIDFDNDGNGFGLEVQQKLGKQSRVFANIYEVNDDAEDMGKKDAISVGMRVDF
ncbi:porin [Neptunomonas marina]|uniref:Porin n=2 Tax=Oceanospirillaceae TaxID=135620 RepID=A0A437QEM3_9GAMM|nr:porin [Neptunomonas marina]